MTHCHRLFRGSHSSRLLPLALFAMLPSAWAVAQEKSAARHWNEAHMDAIRITIPNPPGHARTLFHNATAMYDAWAAYDAMATGYLYNEKISPLPGDIEAARHEAISYAAYRLLRARFSLETVNSTEALSILDAKLVELGYSTTVAQAAALNLPVPAELGKRVADAILAWGYVDGWDNSNYPEPYSFSVNPNLAYPIHVMGNNYAGQNGMQLGYGIPALTNPNFWQPLSLASINLQNNIILPGGVQTFLGVQGLSTTPFSLTRTDPTRPWIDLGGPSKLSTPGNESPTDANYKEEAMGVLRFSSKLNDETVADYSPATVGNNSLAAEDGHGHTANPVTGQPYAPNPVKRGDAQRVMAEFWADGPRSETPPGHWHVLANEVADDPDLVRKIRGTGPVVNALEWDVKAYFALAAACHDAACACWSAKRFYSGQRPITMIRYMASVGQSSDSNVASYHPSGLPLEPGVSELITPDKTGPGGKFELIWDVGWNGYRSGALYHDEVAVFSWPGENPLNGAPPAIATHQHTVRWMLGRDWLPFQRKGFNTPAFPGYPSGHSTFSRAAAETLALLTGSPYFPGGFHSHTVDAHSMQIDEGPSASVNLQWASYFDASDQSGESRRWGGIHPREDDMDGRRMGAQAGKSAFALAEKYWTGGINQDGLLARITKLPDGRNRVDWNPSRGMYHMVQASTDLVHWDPVSPWSLSYDNGALTGSTSGTWTDDNPPPGHRFYRVLRSPTAN